MLAAYVRGRVLLAVEVRNLVAKRGIFETSDRATESRPLTGRRRVLRLSRGLS